VFLPLLLVDHLLDLLDLFLHVFELLFNFLWKMVLVALDDDVRRRGVRHRRQCSAPVRFQSSLLKLLMGGPASWWTMPSPSNACVCAQLDIPGLNVFSGECPACAADESASMLFLSRLKSCIPNLTMCSIETIGFRCMNWCMRNAEAAARPSLSIVRRSISKSARICLAVSAACSAVSFTPASQSPADRPKEVASVYTGLNASQNDVAPVLLVEFVTDLSKCLDCLSAGPCSCACPEHRSGGVQSWTRVPSRNFETADERR